MHIPMAREEIAEFLEVSTDEIDRLWRKRHLQRSIFDDKRPSPVLARSSMFDVIEFALWSGSFPVKITKSDAAMWVLYLCELCEEETWQTQGLTERVTYLLDAAQQDGLHDCNWWEAARIASTVIAAHWALLNVCAENDRNTKLLELEVVH